MKNFLIFIFFALLFVPQVFAKTYPKLPLPTSTPAPTPTPIVINSFELFWPMVAGKTASDSLYPVKVFKEKLRGILIFGSLQKVDYDVFLLSKRSLEIEKLLNDQNNTSALKTIASSKQLLAHADTSLSSYKQKVGVDPSSLGPQIVARLDKIISLLTWLGAKSSSNQELLKDLVGLTSSFRAKL